MSGIATFTVNERSSGTIMLRVETHDGDIAVRTDLSSISYEVFDTSSTGTAVTSGTLTVSSVMEDSLQTDSRWTPDATGYNFAWSYPVAVVPSGDKTYQVEFVFTPVSGDPFRYPIRLRTRQLYGS